MKRSNGFFKNYSSDNIGVKMDCSFPYASHFNSKKVELKRTRSREQNGEQVKLSGIVQPVMTKNNARYQFNFVCEIGTFYLNANEEFLKLFNYHQWEEFIIKGRLVGNIISVKTAKLKHRPGFDIEHFQTADDPFINEKVVNTGLQIEPYFDEAV